MVHLRDNLAKAARPRYGNRAGLNTITSLGARGGAFDVDAPGDALGAGPVLGVEPLSVVPMTSSEAGRRSSRAIDGPSIPGCTRVEDGTRSAVPSDSSTTCADSSTDSTVATRWLLPADAALAASGPPARPGDHTATGRPF